MAPGMIRMIDFVKAHMELYDLRLNDVALVERYKTLLRDKEDVILKNSVMYGIDLTAKALRIALLKAFTEIGQIPTFPQHSKN